MLTLPMPIILESLLFINKYMNNNINNLLCYIEPDLYLCPHGRRLHNFKHGNMTMLYRVIWPSLRYGKCKICFKPDK